MTAVLIFGGGYNTAKDELTERKPDHVGNAIFVVNADDGSVIWSGSRANGHTESLSKNNCSTPGSVSLLVLEIG